LRSYIFPTGKSRSGQLFFHLPKIILAVLLVLLFLFIAFGRKYCTWGFRPMDLVEYVDANLKALAILPSL
jgi:Mn2+/Fe2+ NRAMP family transporter